MSRSDIRKTVGAWLRAIRNRKGMTQEEVAERAEVSAKYYSEVERGLRNITLLNLQRLLDGLEVRTEDVIRLFITEGISDDDLAIIELSIRHLSQESKRTKRQVHAILKALAD